MPIEIRELIIKTTIVDNEFTGMQTHTQSISKKEMEMLKKEIIQLCVDKIEDTFNKQKER